MAKFSLLPLDANVIIQLFEFGIWDQFLDRCEVHVSKTIVRNEVLFYEDSNGEQQAINLSRYADRMTVHDPGASPQPSAGALPVL